MNSKLEIRTGTVTETKEHKIVFSIVDDKGEKKEIRATGGTLRNAVFHQSGITYEAVQVKWYNTHEVTKWCNGTLKVGVSEKDGLKYSIITPDRTKRYSLGLKFSSYATINDYIVRYSDGNYEVISDTDFQDLIKSGVLIEN